MKNNKGSLTIIAIFTVLLFSLYGILLFGRSASSYIRQSKSIETIQKAYAQDVPNAVYIAEQIGSTSTYIGEHYTVTFDDGNGNRKRQIVPAGDKVERPSDPIGETGDFVEWYYVVEGGTESNPTYTNHTFNFDIPPTQNYTLFAKYKGEAIMRSQNGNPAFWSATYKPNITSITFKKDDITVPSTAIESWDVKANNDCSIIMAYVEDDEIENGKYKLTIVSPYTIYGNPRGNYYFNGFTSINGKIN